MCRSYLLLTRTHVGSSSTIMAALTRVYTKPQTVELPGQNRGLHMEVVLLQMQWASLMQITDLQLATQWADITKFIPPAMVEQPGLPGLSQETLRLQLAE